MPNNVEVGTKTIKSPGEGQPALVLQAYDGAQIGDILQVVDVNGAVLARIDKMGLALAATLVKAGAPVDGDFANPRDGLTCVDSTNNKFWCRVGGVWKGVAIA